MEYLKNELEIYCFLKNPKPKVPFQPSGLYIEPTNSCNINCLMCAREKMDRELGFLALKDFKFIIDKLIMENFYPPLTITGNGEPLLHKSIFSMIKYAKDKGFNVSLISNSTLLNDAKIEQLITSGLDRYQTMFDSINKNEFENLRKGSNFEKTQNNIISFINKNEEAGHPIFISIGLVKTSINKNIEETKSFWEGFPIDNFFISPLLALQADSGMYKEAISNIDRKKYKICIVPWIAMSLSFKGEVVLCSNDFSKKYVVGNIFKDSIQEIWNGERAQKLRSALLNNDLSDFTKIGHDCEKCNSPYVMYSISDYLESIPSRILQKIRTYHN